MPEQTMPFFRTPEEVAPELGMTKTELRRYCRLSPKHHTRLSNRRIMLDAENVKAVIEYVKQQSNQPTEDLKTGEINHFA